METKLKPARTFSEPRIKIITDLDALVSNSIGVKLGGKVYRINPVDTETFMKLSANLSAIQKILDKREKGEEIFDAEVYEVYTDFIQSVCPDITLSVLKSCTLAQINALVVTITKHMMGGTQNEMQSDEVTDTGEKKKSVKL
jgi:hypothetical protein